MREILFRGKRIDNDEWTYGSFIPDLLEVYHNGSGEWIGDWGFIKPFGKTKQERLMVEVDRKTVGQYTGLTDKNGKKIFEGDIVKHYYNDKFDIGKIFFCEESCTFLRTCGSNIRYDENYCIIMASCVYEVIGNIYDNPELRVRQYGTDEE